MPDLPASIGSVCVYCASSDAADPVYMEAAAAFGKALAREGLRLVYGGGNIGLMGACARAAHAAGGRVLGVMPEFLRQREILYGDVETIIVASMHERKMIMFEQSDAFVVLPGGVGTLEEVIEMMSWRRLEVHRKPIVFHSPGGFWEPLYALFQHTVDHNLTPAAFMDTWRSVETVEAILPALRELAATGGPVLEARMPKTTLDQR